MKKTIKKLISVILVVLIIFNFFYSNYVPVYGAEILQTVVNYLVNIMGGVIGIFTWIPRLIVMGVSLAVNILTAQVAYMDGITKGATGVDFGETIVITPFEIFFNKVQLLDVNFLDIKVGGTTQVFRTAVAQWYYIMRLIAVSILLLILIYVGIRMALSTVASEKAIYKKTLVDWMVSLALVFVLQYVIMFTVHANAAIIAALETAVEGTKIEEKILGIALLSLGISFESMASTAVYLIFVVQVLMFVLKYIKRMLTVAFLIIISPLISITYSIDKMGDGKAQALNTWMKEFVYNVLIQPFHCIIYMAFIGTAFNLLSGGGDSIIKGIAQLVPGLGTSDLANAIIAIMCMFFVDDAETIVKKIFGFGQASSLDSKFTTALLGAGLYKGAKNIAGSANNIRKRINFSKQKGLLGAVSKDFNNFRNRGKIAQRANVLQASGMNEKDAKQKARIENETAYKANKEAKRTEKAEKRSNTFFGRKAQEFSRKKNERRESKIAKQMEADMGTDAYNKLVAGQDTEEGRKAFEAKRKEAAEKVDKKANRGRRITGAVGGAFSNSLNWQKENAGKIAAGFIGTTLGGMGGGIPGAIAGGIALSEFANNFLSTTTGNMAKEAAKSVSSEHAESYEELYEHLVYVTQTGESGGFEQSSELSKDILGDLKAILNSKFKDNPNVNASELYESLRNNIAHEKLANPQTFNLESILQSTLKKAGASESDAKDEKLNKAAERWANFRNDANLYQSVSTATSVGVPLETFAKKLYKQLEGSSGQDEYTVTHRQEVTVNKVIENLNRTENIDEIVNTVDDSQVQSVIARIRTEIKNNTDLTSEQITKYNTAIDKFKDRLPNPGGSNE